MPVHKGDIFTMLAQKKKAVTQIPAKAANSSKSFFVDGFALQGWEGDGGLSPWLPRKDNRNDKPILVGKGTLRKSLVKVVQGNYIAVKVNGAAAAYADVHNFGFRGSVSVRGKKTTFTRHMNIPQRQFLGPSKQLEDKIRAMIEWQLNK